METFAGPMEFVEQATFARDRAAALAAFDAREIDGPILDLILEFARRPECFTLQSCYGHFVLAGEPDRRSLAPLPAEDPGPVLYRIAYLALCIEPGAAGARLRQALASVPALDPEYVQFGSPTWFRERHPNVYALQVEPDRFKYRDEVTLAHPEALHIERVRDRFFERLRGILRESGETPGAPA